MYRIGGKGSVRNDTHTSLFGRIIFMCALVNTASCRSFNNNAFGNENYGNAKPNDENDLEFDWQLSTDNVEFYKILPNLDLEDVIRLLKDDTSNNAGDDVPARKRRRRSVEIFGRNDLKKITMSSNVEAMPYAATVRISSGCSGTLIGPKHVLTAAHCVFKGPKRTTKTRVKVGFLFTNGIMRWRKVRKIYVPQQWYTLIKKKDRSKYDFAVLELRREHRRPYMTPNTFHRSHGSKIRFNGFKNNKNANTMWTTRCFVHHNWNGYLINRCDVAKGMSGSGSYLFLNRKNYIVRGLVVAAVSFRKGQDVYRFNVVNPLTREKTKQICRWMKAGSDCKSFM